MSSSLKITACAGLVAVMLSGCATMPAPEPDPNAPPPSAETNGRDAAGFSLVMLGFLAVLLTKSAVD